MSRKAHGTWRTEHNRKQLLTNVETDGAHAALQQRLAQPVHLCGCECVAQAPHVAGRGQVLVGSRHRRSCGSSGGTPAATGCRSYGGQNRRHHATLDPWGCWGCCCCRCYSGWRRCCWWLHGGGRGDGSRPLPERRLLCCPQRRLLRDAESIVVVPVHQGRQWGSAQEDAESNGAV